ncbi:MAG: cytidylate kinase-like family protein [Alloprevotella sp.]|nr:cytidylate kinase-like family protein [Alloprevotella sp.]
MPQPFFSICIGRQLASGGRALGRLLAERLEAAYYDSELLDLAARESGFSREVFERNDERRGFFGSAIRSMASVISTGGQFPQPAQGVRLFELQAEAIRKAAAGGNCIFIGRAADYILRDHPRCLSVFVSASDAERKAALMEDKGISEAEARHMMERVDAKRAAFYNFYSGRTWGAAASYDLCINVSRTGIARAADLIAGAL